MTEKIRYLYQNVNGTPSQTQKRAEPYIDLGRLNENILIRPCVCIKRLITLFCSLQQCNTEMIYKNRIKPLFGFWWKWSIPVMLHSDQPEMAITSQTKMAYIKVVAPWGVTCLLLPKLNYNQIHTTVHGFCHRSHRNGVSCFQRQADMGRHVDFCASLESV